MNPTNKVQTRETVVQWLDKYEGHDKGLIDPIHAAMIWNAALDSVKQPEGKRFEVGDRARTRVKDGFFDGTIGFKPDHGSWIDTDPSLVEILPQTVELTDDEKLAAVEDAMAAKSEDPRISVVRDLAKQLTGKTLDQLCTDYNVPTTREV